VSSRRWVEPDFPVLESKLAMQHARLTLRKIFTATLAREGKDAPLMAWPLACGGKTAERTSAIAFADGVLTVAVPDKAWRQQLQSFSRQYLASLNQLSAEPVNSIEFVMMNQPKH
jgi:hypothetical protein